MDLSALIQYIEQGGVTALLVLAVYLGLRGLVVPGDEYARVLRERDEWKDVALKCLEHSGGATQVQRPAEDG